MKVVHTVKTQTNNGTENLHTKKNGKVYVELKNKFRSIEYIMSFMVSFIINTNLYSYGEEDEPKNTLYNVI